MGIFHGDVTLQGSWVGSAVLTQQIASWSTKIWIQRSIFAQQLEMSG
jgi:hypothetical protein